MTLEKLVDNLNHMYKNANKGEVITMIHLFGVRNAKYIGKDKITTASKLVKASNLNNHYSGEVNDGVRLSKYVIEK